MNKFLAGIFLFILAVNASSCGLVKHRKSARPATDSTVAKADTLKAADTTAAKVAIDTVSKPKTDTTATTVVISPEKKMLIDKVSTLWTQPFDYTTFEGKAKMSYGNKDFSANIRIKKDSAIWINISGSLLGLTMQVARIYITPDTLKIVNNLQKEATVMPISEAAKLLPTPMDFAALQNFVVGQPLRKEGMVTDAKDSAGTWTLEVTDNVYKQDVHYAQADSTMQLILMNTLNPNGPKANIHLTNYTTADGRKFSRNRNMNVDNAGKHYNIEMNFVNQQFDKPVDMPFSIPGNYPVNH